VSAAKPHVYPVQIGDEVTDDKKRDESLGDLGDGADFNCVHNTAPDGLFVRLADYLRPFLTTAPS
jgi:hypothetical protein